MPDKRQDSKQRRAARNRASRDALAARRENVVSSRTAASSSSSSSSKSSSKSGSTRSGGSRRSAAPPPEAAAPTRTFLGLPLGRPGDMAVLLAVPFAILSSVFLLFSKVPVDDRGEPIPPSFGGAARLARETVTGQPLPDHSQTQLAAHGATVLLFLLLPVGVTLFAALYANRRPDRARWLTYTMMGMALVVFFAFGFFFLPSLIALGVGSFQARRADLPARIAERVVPPERSRRGRRVIDAESREVDEDEPIEDEVSEEELVDDEPVDGEDDPLAELEAELDAEGDTEESDVGDNGRKPSS
ncbi:MAG TPA: hypothetical protein VH479_25535 [Acidimicrobiales bacterium]